MRGAGPRARAGSVRRGRAAGGQQEPELGAPRPAGILFFFLFAPPSASWDPPGMLACLPPVGFPRSQPSGLSPSPSAVPGMFPGFALCKKRRSEVGLCTIRSFLLLVWGLSFC